MLIHCGCTLDSCSLESYLHWFQVRMLETVLVSFLHIFQVPVKLLVVKMARVVSHLKVYIAVSVKEVLKQHVT